MSAAEKPTPSSGGLTNRTVAGLLWTGWGKGATTVLQIVLLAVLARLLTPEEFGVVTAALVVIGLSDIFSQLGLGPALVQRRVLEPRHLETAFTASTLLGFLLGALMWLLAPAAARFMAVPEALKVLQALSWLFPLQGFGVVSESLMRRDLRFRRLANIEIAALAFAYGPVAVILARAGWGVWALVVATLARAGLRTLFLMVDTRPRIGRVWEWQAFRELFYFGSGFTVAQVANYAALQGDNVVVSRLLGAEMLGLYGRAYQLMAAPAAVFGTVLDAVLFPAMAQVQDDARRLGAAYRRGIALIALLVLPATPVVVVLAPEIVALMLGAQWSGVVAPLRVLGLGMLFRTSYRMSDSLTRATGAVYRRAWRTALYAALIVGGAAVGHRWGITGVSWGVLIAVTINFVLMAQLSLAVTDLSWWNLAQAHAPAALLAAATLPPVWLAAWALRALHLPSLLVLVAIGALAVALWLALARIAPTLFLGSDGIWMLELLTARLPRRRTAAAGASIAVPEAPLPDPEPAVAAGGSSLATRT